MRRISVDRWRVMVLALSGKPPPPVPDLPGGQHRVVDAPLSPDELAGVTSSVELAMLLGISRQAAYQRLTAAERRRMRLASAPDAAH